MLPYAGYASGSHILLQVNINILIMSYEIMSYEAVLQV
jgi:hypothetical protein